MTFHEVASASPSAGKASTSPRRQPRRGVFLAVLAIGVLLSGCGGGIEATNSVGDPGAGIQIGTLPADRGDASPGHCNGTMGRRAVDEVDVPSGAICVLRGTKVDGNVSVGAGGTLRASGVTVDGVVEGEHARLVEVSDNSSIRGNLSLEQGGSAAVRDSHIRGDLKWEQQSGSLVVLRSRVGGNLRADQNSGGLTISGNRIWGDLGCGQNTPGPTGGGNRVRGHRAGQCAVTTTGKKVTHTYGTRARPQPEPNPVHLRPPCAGDSVSDDPSDDQCDAGGDD